MWILVGGWIVLLTAAAVYAVVDGAPTDREQTTVARARPVVDEAIARVASAAATGSVTIVPAVVAVGPFERVGPCDVTVFRAGERYRRSLTAVVVPGTEAQLLGQVAAALPPAYAAQVRGSENAPRLVADAGYWVLVTGAVVAPGEVRFVADTGDCRPAGDSIDTADAEVPVPVDPAAPVFATLGVAAEESRSAAVACPEGGTTGTREFALPGPPPGDLDALLAGPVAALPDATTVVSTAALYGYLTPQAQVAVRAHEDAIAVTVTGVCG